MQSTLFQPTVAECIGPASAGATHKLTTTTVQTGLHLAIPHEHVGVKTKMSKAAQLIKVKGKLTGVFIIACPETIQKVGNQWERTALRKRIPRDLTHFMVAKDTPPPRSSCWPNMVEVQQPL